MTTIAPPRIERADIREALVAYLEALSLAEPVQARLWHESEITLTQLLVLRMLRDGPVTAGKLGSEAGLSPTSLTRLVDRLERRGLVMRRRTDEDRRCVEIRLEPAGETLLGQTTVLRGTDLHHAVEEMTRDERRGLTAGLRRLVELARTVRRLEA